MKSTAIITGLVFGAVLCATSVSTHHSRSMFTVPIELADSTSVDGPPGWLNGTPSLTGAFTTDKTGDVFCGAMEPAQGTGNVSLLAIGGTFAGIIAILTGDMEMSILEPLSILLLGTVLFVSAIIAKRRIAANRS